MSEHQISRERQDGHAVLTLRGEFDLANSDRLHEALHAELGDGHTHSVVLDMEGVTFMDSTALGVIVGARQLVDGVDRRITVAAAPDAIVRLLAITQVDRVLPMYPDVTAALADGESSPA